MIIFVLLLLTSLSLANAGPGKPLTFFDKKIVRKLEIEFKDWDKLRVENPRGGICNFEYIGSRYDWHHAGSIRVDGVTVENVGIKKRSFCNSFSVSKPAIAIKLDKLHPISPNLKKYFEEESITLNNSLQDPTFLRQCLAYQLFREAGIASPRCNFINVFVNGFDLGLYVNIESIKKPFIEKKFGKDLGNLYEISGELFDYWAIDRVYGHKEGFTDDDRPYDFIKMLDSLHATTSTDFRDLKYFVNLSEFIDYWAMEIILLHWDGLTRGSNNAFIYFDSEEKMHMIPWGVDQVLMAWDPQVAFELYHNNTLAYKMFVDPVMKGQLIKRMKYFLEKIWNEETILSDIEEQKKMILPFIKDKYDYEFFYRMLTNQISIRRSQVNSIIKNNSN